MYHYKHRKVNFLFDIIELIVSINQEMVRRLVPVQMGLSASEIIILRKVQKMDTVKISDIARELGIPPSTLTGVFDRFEKQGYVERFHDANDRRSVLIKGTPRLHEKLDEIRNFVSSELKDISGNLPDGFLERFLQDLSIFQEYLIESGGADKNGRKE